MLKEAYLKLECKNVLQFAIFWTSYLVTVFIIFMFYCTNLSSDNKHEKCGNVTSVLTIVNQGMQIITMSTVFWYLTKSLKAKQYMAYSDHKDKLMK